GAAMPSRRESRLAWTHHALTHDSASSPERRRVRWHPVIIPRGTAMRRIPHNAAIGMSVLFAMAIGSQARAADPPGPSVHKLTIQVGEKRSVQYIGVGLSASDESALRDLQRAENDSLYAEDVQKLRRQYVNDELTLAPHRRDVQRQLYGVNYYEHSAASNSVTAPAAYDWLSY